MVDNATNILPVIEGHYNNEMSPEDRITNIKYWKALINYLATAKANNFLKTTFTGSDRLNEIMYDNKWFMKFPKLRKESIILGSKTLMIYKVFDRKGNAQPKIKLMTTLNNHYQYDELIFWSGMDYNIYQVDTMTTFNYYCYWYDGKYVRFNSAIVNWDGGNWTEPDSEDFKKNAIIIDFDEIPVYIFPNKEEFESQFKDLEPAIQMWVNHQFKIQDDIDIGTNKFILNMRGAPAGERFFEWVRKHEKGLKKSTIISDKMLLMNPNSDNPIDRMYGSLQGDQLHYGAKMSLAHLKEMTFISVSGTSKTSAQQNATEIAQESQLIDNDNKKLQYLWENHLERFCYLLLKYDNEVCMNNTPYKNIDLKVKIETAKSIVELAEMKANGQQKSVKKEANNE